VLRLTGSTAAVGMTVRCKRFAPSLAMFVAVLVPIAVGAVIVDTIVAAAVQLASPNTARGRTAAVAGLAGTGGGALGAVVLGVLADRFGGRAALVVGGGVVLAAVALASHVQSRDASEPRQRRRHLLVAGARHTIRRRASRRA
jgi:MFS family permease